MLHRDIKPANLLLDLRGTVLVTDFGLAKSADADDLTHIGAFVGTLRYMAPERFDGPGDGRADTYALGLTLYELLTLRPAFVAENRAKLVEQVIAAAPRSPRSINPAIPRDLETIVLKATQRDLALRYQTAAELADDLRRYLEDRPIRARRATAAEQVWRWCRRNPAVSALIAAVTFLLVGIAIAASASATYFERTASNERAARQQADTARQQADGARRDRELNLADMYTDSGLTAGERDDPGLAALWFAHAARLALAADDQERAAANRTRAVAWGRKAFRPVRAVVHPTEWVENNMAFHPGGRYLLTHGFDPVTEETDCRLWDLEREAELPFPASPGPASTAAWDATGERLAVGTPEGAVRICRFPGGEPVQRVPFAGRVTRLLFSPDGRYCALVAAGRTRVWGCQQAAFATPELAHPETVETLAFSSMGELLATGCRDNRCHVFAVAAGRTARLFDPVPITGPPRRQEGVSSACHPYRRTSSTRETCS